MKPHPEDLRDLARAVGVRLVIYPEREPSRPWGAQGAPNAQGWATIAWSTERLALMGPARSCDPTVYWRCDDPESLPHPEWLEILHEIGHAHVGSEAETLAWSLMVVAFVFGVGSEEWEQQLALTEGTDNAGMGACLATMKLTEAECRALHRWAGRPG